MNNHQGIKAEIDARNDSFTACIELGKSLLARKHYASEEVSSIAKPMLCYCRSDHEPFADHCSFSIEICPRLLSFFSLV
jgi:hypothetical protein